MKKMIFCIWIFLNAITVTGMELQPSAVVNQESFPVVSQKETPLATMEIAIEYLQTKKLPKEIINYILSFVDLNSYYEKRKRISGAISSKEFFKIDPISERWVVPENYHTVSIAKDEPSSCTNIYCFSDSKISKKNQLNILVRADESDAKKKFILAHRRKDVHNFFLDGVNDKDAAIVGFKNRLWFLNLKEFPEQAVLIDPYHDNTPKVTSGTLKEIYWYSSSWLLQTFFYSQVKAVGLSKTNNVAIASLNNGLRSQINAFEFKDDGSYTPLATSLTLLNVKKICLIDSDCAYLLDCSGNLYKSEIDKKNKEFNIKKQKNISGILDIALDSNGRQIVFLKRRPFVYNLSKVPLGRNKYDLFMGDTKIRYFKKVRSLDGDLSALKSLIEESHKAELQKDLTSGYIVPTGGLCYEQGKISYRALYSCGKDSYSGLITLDTNELSEGIINTQQSAHVIPPAAWRKYVPTVIVGALNLALLSSNIAKILSK